MPSPGRPPTDLLQGLRTSTADLLLTLADTHWTDADVAAATLLPDWTTGHLLTHLARNADGVAGTLAGALRGEIVAQYPGGREQRAADIDAGAGRPMAALLADVRDSADKLDRVLGALGEADAWDRTAGDDLPAHAWLPRRWLEVETHRVDLGLSYTPDRWPPLFVATVLPLVAPSLANRTDDALAVSVDPAGSVSAATGSWTTDGGTDSGTDAVQVRGSDWAVLAWLMGRPAPDTLTASPALRAWSWALR